MKENQMGQPSLSGVSANSSANCRPTTTNYFTDPRVAQIVGEIETRYRAQISFHRLAADLNLSPSRMRHLFKTITGESPTSYLRRVRLRHSRILLETTFLSVKEIAIAVGAKDYSHFVRDFERAFGFSPARYRKICAVGVFKTRTIFREVGKTLETANK